MLETLRVARTQQPRRPPEAGEVAFGSVFSDHMLVARYEEARGWHEAGIEPYGALTLDPAAAVLHYGQAVFEGMKAFRGVDERVSLFRPRDHLERLAASARRLCMPAPPLEEALHWLAQLVRIDRQWAPREAGGSLYVRPVIFADEPFLGVRPARSYTLLAITSPVWSYSYGAGGEAIRVRVEDELARAAPGGVGAAKTGGNYAAGLYASQQALAAGFLQVLWLDGAEKRYLDEIGTMNVMLRVGDDVLTPSLSDSILAGVTRDSALTLLRDWGVRVVERRIAVEELVGWARSGELREIWGTGTASLVQAVGGFEYRGEGFSVGDGGAGETANHLRSALSDIQYGRSPDRYGWLLEV